VKLSTFHFPLSTSLVVTCQTVRRRVAFFVATQAPPHRQRRGLNSGIHPRHVAMTRLAGDAGQDVTLVCKPHKIGEIVHAEPRNRFLPFPVSEKLDDLRLVRRDGQVALGTALNRWNTSDRTATRVRVAQLTRNRIVSGMEAMAERDRLCGVLCAQAGKKCEQSAENERERR
jgi:ribosomal protein L36